MRIANASRGAGDYGNAINLYRHAATMEPGNPEPFVALGGTLLDAGKVDEAILNYNAALKISKREPPALRGLAKCYLKTGRPDLAASSLALAYQDTPNDAKLLLLIGVADDFIGQHPAAQARYQRGLRLVPGDRALILDLAPKRGLARAAARRGKKKKADRFERESETFHEALRQAFLDIARAEPQRCAIIDADRAAQAVEQAIWESVRERLGYALGPEGAQ